MGHQATISSDFLVMEKKKINEASPMIAQPITWRVFPGHRREGSNSGRAQQSLELRKQRQAFREAKLARICRSGYQKEQNCTEREFRGLQRVPQSLQLSMDQCMLERKLPEARERITQKVQSKQYLEPTQSQEQLLFLPVTVEKPQKLHKLQAKCCFGSN